MTEEIKAGKIYKYETVAISILRPLKNNSFQPSALLTRSNCQKANKNLDKLRKIITNRMTDMNGERIPIFVLLIDFILLAKTKRRHAACFYI